MLSDRCYQLLTAYVDGELSVRQRKAVQRLLRRSQEARSLLRQLRADAEALRQLPRRQLAADFSERVLQSLRERGLSRRQRLARTQSQPFPAWVGMALAASVLFLVGFGSYFYFTLTLPRPDNAVAGRPPEVPSNTARSGPVPENVKPAPPKDDHPAAAAPKQPDLAPEGPRNAARHESANPGAVPAAGPNPENTLTLPVPEKEMFQPQGIDVALPVIFQFAALDGVKLRDELRKDSGFRLEVPCHESSRAFDRLQAAFKAHGVGLLIDQVAQSRLKQAKLQTNFVLYAEDLLPEELAGILQHVGKEDRKAEARHRQFDGLVVSRMSKDDRKELSTLLGIDPRQVQAPRSGAPLGLDPKKPLAEMTADQVAQALAGHGSTSSSEPGKSAAKAAEHLAVVLPYNPVRPRPGSAEVKRFLDSRKPPRTGTVQVLLVLRETKR
jgi:anti-sigma factor RsiW